MNPTASQIQTVCIVITPVKTMMRIIPVSILIDRAEHV